MKYAIVMCRYTENMNEGYYFPLGMAYVSSSLKNSGREVLTYNLNYKEGAVKELVADFVRQNDIDVLATGGLTGDYAKLKEILDAAREAKPDIILEIGGGGITASPIPMMEALETADYGMIGEGEITICELAEALEGKREIHTVDGLIYKQNDTWVITHPRAEIMDLDSIAYPDYEGFEYDLLLSKASTDTVGFAKERVGAISLSRSCPFQCTFCFHPSGTKYRRRSVESAFGEIDYLIERFDIRNLFISDELFLANMEDAKRFCIEIKKRNIGFCISLRVDMVNREFLEMLRDHGCLQISFGLESADNRILKSMNKKITIEQIEFALSLCNEIGIKAQGNFIFGDEAETMETAKNTFRWWQSHPEHSIRTGLIVLYPGSILYEHACKKGIIKDEVQFIKDGCPITNVSSMSDQEYRDMALMISMLSQESTDRLTDVSFQYVGDGKIDYTGRCPQCGQLNTWTTLEPFRIVSNFICEHCGRSMHIVPSDSIGYIAQKNFSLINKSKIAIWAMTNMIEKMREAVPDIMGDNVYFVDSAKLKQGGKFHEKTVQAPDIIRDKGIDIVFLATSAIRGTEIIEQIKEYPSVKYIFYAGELFNPNFSDAL